MNTCFLILLALIAQAQTPPPAIGDASAKTKAQTLLREGAALHDGGDHAGALDKFQSAYAVYPSAKILFNIGEANRNLARPVEALEAFEEFLAKAIDAPAQSIAEARQSVTELKGKLGRIAVECRTSGAEISVDGKRIGVAPLPRPVWAVPGRHQVSARHADFAPAVEDVVVAAGALGPLLIVLRPLGRSLDLAAPAPGAGADVAAMPPLAPGTSSSPPADEEGSLTRKWWFWTAIGAVVVLGTVGIVAATADGGTPVPKSTLGAQPAMPASLR